MPSPLSSSQEFFFFPDDELFSRSEIRERVQFLLPGYLLPLSHLEDLSTCQSVFFLPSPADLLFATRREILFDLPYYVVCSRYVVEAVSKRFQIGPLKLATGSDLDCVMLTPLKRKSAERAIDFPPVCKPGSLFSSSSPHPQVYIYTHTHTHRVSVTNCPRTFSSLAL